MYKAASSLQYSRRTLEMFSGMLLCNVNIMLLRIHLDNVNVRKRSLHVE